MWNFDSTDCPIADWTCPSLDGQFSHQSFSWASLCKDDEILIGRLFRSLPVEKSLMTLITLKTITPLTFSRLCLQLPWQRCFSHGVAAESTFSNGSGAVDAVELSLFWCSHLALPRCLESLASLVFRFLGWESWSLYFKLYHYFYNF